MPDDAFAQMILAVDLADISQLFAHFFAERASGDWEAETEPGGWTLHQTAAHLDAVATGYLHFIQTGIDDLPSGSPDLQKRADLPGWNERQIAKRMELPIAQVIESFLITLQECASLVGMLSEEDLAKTVKLPAYGRSLSIAELFGAQAAHPGLVHAAQVTNAVHLPPLWRSYPTEQWRRQLTRTFCLMAASYWPERGGALDTAVNFIARGQAGASWYVHMSPQGCTFGTGRADKASLSLYFRNLDTVSCMLTGQLSPQNALLTGMVFAWGRNPFLGLCLPRLFNPT